MRLSGDRQAIRVDTVGRKPARLAVATQGPIRARDSQASYAKPFADEDAASPGCWFQPPRVPSGEAERAI